MMASLMSDLCSSKQLLLLSEAKNIEGLMPPPPRFTCKLSLVERSKHAWLVRKIKLVFAKYTLKNKKKMSPELGRMLLEDQG